MSELYQEKDRVLRITKYTLANGKQLLVLTTGERISYYHCWPNSPWEPIAPEILRSVPLRGIAAIAAEIKGFELAFQ